jgi:SnoaL-like domain
MGNSYSRILSISERRLARLWLARLVNSEVRPPARIFSEGYPALEKLNIARVTLAPLRDRTAVWRSLSDGRVTMDAEMPKAVWDAADTSAITQLILRERESRDLGRWDDMRTCFFADSVVRISWFHGNGADFVTGSMEMARRKIFAKHRLAPIRVVLSGDRAIARLVGIIDLPVRIKKVDMNLATYSRFIYRVERRRGAWGIVGFDAVYMRDELTTALPGQSVKIDPKQVQGFRPSYRMLSYYLASQGYDIDANLPGEDRPDLVDTLTKEIEDWAVLRP